MNEDPINLPDNAAWMVCKDGKNAVCIRVCTSVEDEESLTKMMVRMLNEVTATEHKYATGMLV